MLSPYPSHTQMDLGTKAPKAQREDEGSEQRARDLDGYRRGIP